jgi:hypothetical protein
MGSARFPESAFFHQDTFVAATIYVNSLPVEGLRLDAPATF